MDAVIVASIKFLGDGLARCLDGQADVKIVRVIVSIDEARALLAPMHIVAILIDMSQPIDLEEVRSLAMVDLGGVLCAVQAGRRGPAGRGAEAGGRRAATHRPWSDQQGDYHRTQSL